MAKNAVYIDFISRGHENVSKAIRSITQTIIAAENRAVTAARSGSSARVREAASEAAAKIRLAQQSEAMAGMARRAGARSVEQSFRAEARAAAAAANERIRNVARVAAEEQRLRAESLRAAIKKNGIKSLDVDQPHVVDALVPRRSKGPESADLEALRKQRAQQKIDAINDASQRKQDRESAKSARAEEKTAQGAAKAKIAAMKVADREAERARAAGVKVAERAARDEARAFEAGEREKTRAAERWVRQRERETGRRREQFAKTVTGAGSRAVGAAAGIAHRAVGMAAGTLAGLGGGFSVEDSIKQQADLERQAVQFSNSAFLGKPGEERLSPEKIQQQAKAAGIRTGTSASDILAGAAGYGAKTGDYKEAFQAKPGESSLAEFFGQVSKGTGASVEDVAKTAGMLRVQNKDLKPDQMKQLLLDTIRQGQLGSVEFSDLARVAGKVTRTSSSYAGDQTANQGKLLGLAQIAMRTSGSPEEAATVLSNISADAGKHSKDVAAKLGKDTFNAQGQIAKAPEEFIADIMEKTGGNLQKIQAMGFGQRSMKMFQALAPTFNAAQEEVLTKSPKDAKGAAKAGRESVLKDIREVTGGSMNVEELQANVKRVLSTSGEQFEAAMRELREVVGSQLLPAFKDLVPPLVQLMPTVRQLLEALVGLANWATKNPFSGFAALVTGFFVKELVAAKIGDTIKSILTKSGSPGGGGGGGGVVAGAVGTGIAAGAVISKAMLGYNEGVEQAQDIRAKVQAWQRGDHERGMSPEEAQKAIDMAKGHLEKHGGVLETAANLATSPFVEASDRDYKATKGAEGLTESDEGRRLQAELVQALKDNTAATRQNSQTAPQTAPTFGPPRPPSVPSGPGPIRDSAR